MSVFAWTTIHYTTLDTYRRALMPFKVPPWIKGITLHHSYIPTRAQWRGHATMEGTKQYYIGLGWPAGPHLFLAADVPNSSDAGIWAGTPLASPGVHAGKCNADHIGIEIVGNYDIEPWPVAVADLVYGVVPLLMQWAGIPPERVQGHFECLNDKSCPGSKIHMDDVRAELARRRAGTPPPPAAPAALTNASSLIAPPRATQQQCVAYITKRVHGVYSDLDIASIVRSYFAYASGLDPLIAIAQMIKETGNLTSSWSQPPRHNPAGIGVTGAKGVGLSFATWEDAVRAHVGRLLAYALKQGTGSAGQQVMIDHALALRSLPAAYRGAAPTLQGLNTRWAKPGLVYANAIVEIGNAIMGI
jgi:hypothetical protein